MIKYKKGTLEITLFSGLKEFNLLEWLWRNKLYYMKFQDYLSKPTVLSIHGFCFNYFDGFFQNVLHASLPSKKEFIERKLPFSRWLGVVIDNITYYVVLWFSGVFRAAYGYVQLFTPQLNALDCCAFMFLCLLYTVFLYPLYMQAVTLNFLCCQQTIM